MALIYGEEKTDEEVIDFVKNYIQSNCRKGSRFDITMSLVPHGHMGVLDYGCGWGHYSVAMRDKGHVVEAIDLSQNEIDICNIVWGNSDRLHFACKKISEYSDESFDMILSCQVIEHVHNVGNYLSQINRALKSGGRLVISLPNIMNPRFFLPLLHKNLENRLKALNAETFRNYHKGTTHIHAWDPGHFVHLLSSTGFLVDRYLPSEGIPFPARTPFIPCVQGWVSKLPRIRNLSYTMHFLCTKVKTIAISPDD